MAIRALDMADLQLGSTASCSTDLVDMLGRIPPLLAACICVEPTALKTLRLVNTDASRVALLGVRSYTLNVDAYADEDDPDTELNAAEVKLIQRLPLTFFKLCLTLDGENWVDGTRFQNS